MLYPRELQARAAAGSPRRVFSSPGEGVNDPRAAARAPSCRSSLRPPSPGTVKQKGPSRAPADRVERTSPVQSGAGRALRPTAERPAGQRPTAACWGCVGDGGAGRFLVVRRPALRLCTTLSLFTCGALACSVVEEGIEPSRPSRVPVSFEPGALNLSATPPGAVRLFAPIAHGLHRIARNRRRLFWPCRDPRRSPLGSRPGKQAPRAEAETRTCVSPLAIAMQFG